jgi:hypothetical protein
MSPNFSKLGQYPGKEKMPVDETILTSILSRFSKYEQFENPEFARKCIMDNRHNAITATYHLESKKESKDASGIKEQNRAKWFSRLKQTEKAEAQK